MKQYDICNTNLSELDGQTVETGGQTGDFLWKFKVIVTHCLCLRNFRVSSIFMSIHHRATLDWVVPTCAQNIWTQRFAHNF